MKCVTTATNHHSGREKSRNTSVKEEGLAQKRCKLNRYGCRLLHALGHIPLPTSALFLCPHRL
ncbi:hypothetical protein GH733_014554 [Mirounga leonina]|nr:hypothetical protein GH733_014554 [Mirounga leonina]